MTQHLFVDESRRGGTYLLAAVAVPTGALAEVRAVVRSAVLPRQRRVHFVDEKDARRKQLIAAWLELRAQCGVYVVTNNGRRTEDEARDACLTALVTAALRGEVARLVIESREGRDHMDRRLIRGLLGRGSTMTYEHMRPHEEPLLWFADGVGWCWGAGGTYRQTLTACDRFTEQPVVI